ncbi:MAG: tRNA preQ1(34) S-adenosylmethionine ribosyltransferase-isomerase QueA [Bacillota bacterium]
MKTAAFSYDLPAALIAQEPLPQRDDSRLLVLQRRSGAVEHAYFRQLPLYLDPGDLLVMNDTRVFPARLLGRQEKGGRPVELLLLRPRENGQWEALCRPGKRARPGDVLVFGEGELVAEVLAATPTGERSVCFRGDKPLESLLSSLGQLPMPPYIKKELHDAERYQTVYARSSGSVAAPTAGLHFTERIFAELKRRGIGWTFVTLHVGAGTFRPVKVEYAAQHRMHSERFSLKPAVAEHINRTKEQGFRVVAVGTTCCRVLETLGGTDGRVRSGEGETDLYIYPGYCFKVVDALITNFHLPRSTLLMLVSAFAGREETLRAYAEAVRERYRFYSFGDAMLIL